jgi:hypothetical protein
VVHTEQFLTRPIVNREDRVAHGSASLLLFGKLNITTRRKRRE